MDSDDSFLRYIQNRADVDANRYYDIIAHGILNGNKSFIMVKESDYYLAIQVL